MSPNWLKVNEKLQNGIALINLINTETFIMIMKRIVDLNNDKSFTTEEITELEKSLILDVNNVRLLLQSIAYILRQATKIIIKPTDLQKELIEDLHLEKEKAEEFVKVWSNELKNDFPDLENRKLLEDLSWQVNLQGGSSLASKETIPKATIQLHLNSLKENSTENVTMELGEEELLHIYNTLENIQSKLDSL